MQQIDPLAGYMTASTAMGERHFAVAPSDAEDLPIRPHALYVVANGNVVIRDDAGQELAYPVTAGQILPFRGVRIMATGTTATLYGWW